MVERTKHIDRREAGAPRVGQTPKPSLIHRLSKLKSESSRGAIRFKDDPYHVSLIRPGHPQQTASGPPRGPHDVEAGGSLIGLASFRDPQEGAPTGLHAPHPDGGRNHRPHSNMMNTDSDKGEREASPGTPAPKGHEPRGLSPLPLP